MKSPVEFHSSYDYAQRPIAVLWEGKRVQIKNVLAEWRSPEGKSFRVQAENGRIFDLIYNEDIENWQVREK
jgi:hypothetical protein